MNAIEMKHPLYEKLHPFVTERCYKKAQPLSAQHISFASSISTEYKKMGCLILAGGEATRLRSQLPKGCVELPVEGNKTPFQILLEEVVQKGANLPLAIMTSPLNHKETVAFLQNYDYFGLTNVEVFQQDMIPVCDDQGFVVFDDQGNMIQSPDGNGKALFHLYHSGIWGRWKKKGIKVVQVIPIDNILAQPFDSELLAEHHRDNFDLVLRVIKREGPTEQLGVVAIQNERIVIYEYSERPPYMHVDVFFYGNSGIFTCTLDFIEKILHFTLPWHLVRKQIFLQEQLKRIWVWKFETFIFDLFPLAQAFTTVVSQRRDSFSPIKNLYGPNSVESASQAFANRLRESIK